MENNNFVEEKFEEVQNKKQQEPNHKNNNGNKKKVTIIALLLAGIVLLGTLSASLISKLFKNDNKNNKDNESKNPEESVVMIEDEIDINELGVEEDLSKYDEQSKEYGDVSGDIDKEEIVEKDDTLWKDEEAANKSDEVGKEEFDNQDNTLEKDEDGDIVEKEEHFEIKDEDGNEVSTGSNESGKPDGYEWDSVLNKYVKEDEVGKYVYSDATYYDTEGNIVIQKGEVILKETFEKIKNDSNLTTIKPEESKPEVKPEESKPEVKPEESKPESSNPTDEVVDSYGGIINKDGTYTIYGVTYMDKATFEAFILDENSQENFGFYNNIIYPVSVIEEMIQTKSNTK